MGGRPAHRRDPAIAKPSRDGLVRQGVHSSGARGRESAVACDVHFRGPTVTLTAKEVAEITRLLEESSFDELYLELDGLKLSLKRGAPGNGQAPRSAPAMAPVPTLAPASGSAPASDPVAVPPVAVLPAAVPPTAVPPVAVPPVAVLPAAVLPAAVPPTAVPHAAV